MDDEFLWTDADQAALARARAALDAGDLTAALLAVEGADAAAIAATNHRLAELAAEVRALAGPERVAPELQAAVLRHVLVDRAGLSGDTEGYYGADNCHLSAVVERGRGMPILLTAVWMIVGARAGLAVCGIGLPGHFVARVGQAPGQIVDPFARGRPLTERHCRSIVRQLTDGRVQWRDDFLDATRLPDLVARVLRNLQICHQKSGDHRALYRAARLCAKLYPERAMYQLIHAQVAELIQATPMAMDLYADVIARFPEHDMVELARKRLEALSEAPPLLH